MTLLYKPIERYQLQSNGLTFEILIQISRNFQGRRRKIFMKIDLELTEKSAKNTQRWWKLTATIGPNVVLMH